VYFVGNKKVLILDSLGVIPENFKPDYIWITQSPKINFDRVLEKFQPQQVIIDGSNKPYLIKMWKANCITKKIPVHVTFEQGFYDFE
jgi:competence protein ComEC